MAVGPILTKRLRFSTPYSTHHSEPNKAAQLAANLGLLLRLPLPRGVISLPLRKSFQQIRPRHYGVMFTRNRLSLFTLTLKVAWRFGPQAASYMILASYADAQFSIG